MNSQKDIKTLFCQTYDIGEDEVNVTDFSNHTLSVEIQNQPFHYSYSIVNKMIKFKPVEK